MWRPSRTIHGQRAIFGSRARNGPRYQMHLECTASNTTIIAMPRARELPAQASADEHETWAARAEARGLALTTHWHQEHGRPSIKETARSQQYLSVEEEKALVALLFLMPSFRQPVRRIVCRYVNGIEGRCGESCILFPYSHALSSCFFPLFSPSFVLFFESRDCGVIRLSVY